jgi:hypothetical protein
VFEWGHRNKGMPIIFQKATKQTKSLVPIIKCTITKNHNASDSDSAIADMQSS